MTNRIVDLETMYNYPAYIASTASILDAFVSISDMARLHVGDEVQIVIGGLAQNVYGTISGVVKQIDSNVSSREGKEGKEGSVNQVFKILVFMGVKV